MRRLRLVLLFLALLPAATSAAEPRRVLYLTHSAGYRHASIKTSVATMQQLAATDGGLEITPTEDVGLLNAADLATYDAVFFFTSGELPVSERQKQDLLDFVREGKGFGGVHSATDTFYSWPEYGELIGARFRGHPWVQDVNIHVEDGEHAAVRALFPQFRIRAETYQFQGFSRERSRVLLTLDVESVDLTAPDVNAGTLDFPLAWVHPYGQGRVFYTALGHFEETWRDKPFQGMILRALLWLTGQAEGDAEPLPLAEPSSSAAQIGNAADLTPAGVVSPNSFLSVFGENLTPGGSAAAGLASPVRKLAGARVLLDGEPLDLIFASPGQINAYLSPERAPAGPRAAVEIQVADRSVSFDAMLADRTPGVFVTTVEPTHLIVWATGLGPVEERDGLFWTTVEPQVRVNGERAKILYSGLAPGWPGLYQVNVLRTAGMAAPFEVELE